MPLPSISAKEAIRVFCKTGFTRVRQSGSHVVLQKRLGHTTVTLVIPNHPELAKGTLRAVIRKAGMSIDEFVRLLRS
ncbi:MAG: type II toxin-antitoxin system HicA family toxin [Elusimicrobia bacterium]|nr:type II toxin-antitoxin system HicA family toxin [Elusimicrobiota bacterium]